MYLWLKCLHIISSTVLLGTGAGIAFFFLLANRSKDVRIIAAVANYVVIADFLFTATAVIVQPMTGLALVLIAGYPLTTHWLVSSIALYVLIGCCWLPVVWLQVRMRNLARAAMAQSSPLPDIYARYYRWWLGLGVPAFISVLGIFALMVLKPGF